MPRITVGPPLNLRRNYVENIPIDQVTLSAVQGGGSIFIAPLPILSVPLVAAVARVYVGITGDNLDIGVYSSDGTTLTLITSTGSTAVGASTTIQSVNLLAPFTLQPGVSYFTGFGVSATTGSIGIGAAMSNVVISAAGPVAEYGRKASGFPIATNATSIAHSALTTITQVFWVRLSPT